MRRVRRREGARGGRAGFEGPFSVVELEGVAINERSNLLCGVMSVVTVECAAMRDRIWSVSVVSFLKEQ